MLEPSILKDLLHQQELSNRDRLLLCLAATPNKPKTVAEIRDIATQAGLRKATSWNISDQLSKATGLAIRTTGGWELTGPGRRYVTQLAGPVIIAPAVKVAPILRTHLSAITNSDTRAFTEEAIRCYEAKLFRAAVVLSWVGAVSLLYDHVIAKHLMEFNAEARKRDPKWRDAKSKDDLSRVKEHDFLQMLHAISVIGKNVKEELEGCLKLRNACGHPSSLNVGEHRVSAHIEVLMLNVFAVF